MRVVEPGPRVAIRGQAAVVIVVAPTRAWTTGGVTISTQQVSPFLDQTFGATCEVLI